MTHLLTGFSTSSVGGVLHVFPRFSPKSLVGPSSPMPRTVSLQQAQRFVNTPPPSPGFCQPACCYPDHAYPLLPIPSSVHRIFWMLMEQCLNTQSMYAREGRKQVIPASVELFFTGMQRQGEGWVTFFSLI